AKVIIAEAQTFIFASRISGPAQVRIFRIKNSVPVAAIPAHQTVEVVQTLRKALPQFVPEDNVLKTSFNNIGAVFHPTITILNAGRIESTHGNFDYYIEGVTPSVALILEEVDKERVKVGEALGIRAITAREWLYSAYDAHGRNLFEAIQNNPGYYGIKAPSTIFHRYLTEDIPASLVPISSLGHMLETPTPTIDAMIHLACVLHGRDYRQEGRTVEKLGLKGLSVKEIREMVVMEEEEKQ
ncbi:MAG TPA: NAD/NADP octopine/nopaline dehydrogenase family protein, partial [Candidatus Atribacteria bacterium]|nr:NAD/NADP octopine/nopaline dehydrogenase family protein [Candidatus Atribacteria bacterium]